MGLGGIRTPATTFFEENLQLASYNQSLKSTKQNCKCATYTNKFMILN